MSNKNWNAHRTEIENDIDKLSTIIQEIFSEAEAAGWSYENIGKRYSLSLLMKPINKSMCVTMILHLSEHLDEFDKHWNGRWEINISDYPPSLYPYNQERVATFRPFQEPYDEVEFRRLFKNFLRNGELEAHRRIAKAIEDAKNDSRT